MESIGTKAFTKKEIENMLKKLPVEIISIKSAISYYDKLGNKNKLLQYFGKMPARVFGDKYGWWLTMQFIKV